MALLGGYLYVHLLTSLVPPRWLRLLHIALGVVSATVLPLALTTNAPFLFERAPVPWVLLVLLSTVGAPFFMVSTSAPLLQWWYSKRSHASTDPYFLYSISNVGSMAALLSYPLLIEPSLSVRVQAEAWGSGYLVLLVLIAASLFCHLPRVDAKSLPPSSLPQPSLLSKAEWIFLAFVPSSVMLSVTTHLTANIAAVPLLWVVPLGIYLVTFIAAFAPGGEKWFRRTERVFPFLFVILAPFVFFEVRSAPWLSILVQSLFFFSIALLCHGKLSDKKPEPAALTLFYIYIAFGGALGGSFNALIAPLIFGSVIEYPLSVLLALFVYSGVSMRGATVREKGIVGGACALSLCGLVFWKGEVDPRALLVMYGLPAIAIYSVKHRGLLFAGGMGALLVLLGYFHSMSPTSLVRTLDRNFFGVKKVMVDSSRNLVEFVHGTTSHGCESLTVTQRGEPLCYYHRSGPLGDIFSLLNETSPRLNVGVIGLGVGAMSSYAREGDTFRFFEIDPQVVEIARNDALFSYLSQAKGQIDVRVGDGRALLAKEPPRLFDLLVLDPFSSDSVPAHLVTKEALALYREKITNEGLLLFHISNRYLELEGMLANLAEESELLAFVRDDTVLTPEEVARGKSGSKYLVMGTEETLLKMRPTLKKWQHAKKDPSSRVWSDDYSNIFQLLK